MWDDDLQYVESVEELQKERRKAKVNAALEGLADDIVWEEIGRRRGGGGGESKKSIKQAEIEMLLASPDEMGEDIFDGDFYARTLPLAGNGGPSAKIHRIVLVHRLREVVAQVGFTRLKPPWPRWTGN